MGTPLRTIVLVAAVLIAPASEAQTQPATEAAVEEGFSEATVSTTTSAADHMLASVMIGEAGPFPFIVDTAAERSVISRELAQELRLPSAGSARLLSMTSSREVDMVTVPDVSFVQGRSHTLSAFALNGQHLGAAGVLGIDALRGQRVVLDFEAGELRVGPAPRSSQRIDPDEIIVRGQRRYGQLVLVDSSVGGRPVDVIVDSGSQISVGNDALRNLLVSRRSQFEQVSMLSITGESYVAEYTRVDNLRIGDIAIAGLPIGFADAYFFRRMQLTRRPALLLGMDALRMFNRVIVDFPNRRAHFVVPATSAHRAQ